MALDAVPDFPRMVYKDFSRGKWNPNCEGSVKWSHCELHFKGLNLFFYFDFGSYKRVG